MLLRSVQLLSVFTLTLAEHFCQTYPNYNTQAYTYVVCNGTYAKDLNSTRQFCRDNVEGGDVITFPNYDEYNFIISQVNKTFDEFWYIPGFYQMKDTDRYNPETGKYFWTDAPDVVITKDSKTYWQPFGQLIANFSSFSLPTQQIGSFVLNLDGIWYPSLTLTGGLPINKPDGGVICSKLGVPEIYVASTSESVADGFQYWIIITVAASVTVLGVVVGLIGFCVFKRTKHKTRSSQKFDALPQSENGGNHVPKTVAI